MNNTAKFLRVVSRLPAKRYVSTIRPQPEQVVHKGVTYTKMLHPHTLTANIVNWHWKLLWEKWTWGRMIVYATITVAPFAIYTNYKVFAALYKAKREEKAARKAGKKAHH